MGKFNLQNYKKINGDEHIDMRLEDSRGNIPEVINEKQLEDYRSKEPEVLIEKLLEETRQGSADEVTERRLDTHKSKFANKYRNPSAYEGDLNKLEEKRLSNDPVEKEKYEASSKAPKQLRWWEDVKSEDGLKVAKDVKETKTAQALPIYQMEPGKESLTDEKSTLELPGEEKAVEETEEDFPVDDLTEVPGVEELFDNTMEIIKQVKLPNADKDLSAVYVLLNYSPEAFSGDENEIRETAKKTVLSAMPELDGLIDASDFGMPKEDEDGVGSINLRVFGPQFAPVVENKVEEVEENPIQEISEETIENPVIEKKIETEDFPIVDTTPNSTEEIKKN